MKPTNTLCMLNEVFCVKVGSTFRNPVLWKGSAHCWNLQPELHQKVNLIFVWCRIISLKQHF